MKGITKRSVLITLVVLAGACVSLLIYNRSSGFEDVQHKLTELEKRNITSITLKHYDTSIEVNKSDSNFKEIIFLTSKLTIDSRAKMQITYGVPINILFYDNDELILVVASSEDVVMVDGEKFDLYVDSQDAAGKISTLVGAYFGYHQ